MILAGTDLPRYRNLDVAVRTEEGTYETVKPLPRVMSLQDVDVTGGRGGADDLSATELRALASPDPLPAALAGFGDGDENGGTGASLEEFAAHGFSVTEADGTAVDGGGGDEEDEL